VRQLLVADLGRQPYADALAFQREVARARIAGDVEDDVLLLVEHPPVVTLGRSAKSAHLLASPAYLRQQGVDVFEVERGGDVTFHGPGQLVGYPIIDLKRHRKDLHWYLRQVEESLIQGIAEFGLVGSRVEKYTGVWVGGTAGDAPRPADDSSHTVRSASGAGLHSSTAPPRKIASIGVHARDWVTWHGFALNVNTDLRYFDLIVPCGIRDVTMTSVARELNAGSVAMRAVVDAVVRAFGTTFALQPRLVDFSAFVAEAGVNLADTATH
jgi:lipoyl(octanoyl) transferase